MNCLVNQQNPFLSGYLPLFEQIDIDKMEGTVLEYIGIVGDLECEKQVIKQLGLCNWTRSIDKIIMNDIDKIDMTPPVSLYSQTTKRIEDFHKNIKILTIFQKNKFTADN